MSCPNVDKRWIAWLGGAIDGDGHIGISRSTNQRRRPVFQIVHRVLISITNTDERFLQQARDVLGNFTGHYPNYHALGPRDITRCQAWSLQVNSNRDGVLLFPHLIPWLVIKKEQAEIALAFARRHQMRLGHVRRQSDFDRDELDYARCRLLNRHGNHGGPDIEEMERMVAAASTKSTEG